MNVNQLGFFSTHLCLRLLSSKQNEPGLHILQSRWDHTWPAKVLMFPATSQLSLFSDTVACHRQAAHSRSHLCLKQDLLPVYRIELLWSSKVLELFEICAHTKTFSSFSLQSSILVVVYYYIYLQVFTVSFPNCILLSPLYANTLPCCLDYHPSIYLLIVCDLRYSLASYSQITFCLLSMSDDPFIAQPRFKISSE